MSLQLFNADCFDILPTIEDKSIDLIFCDLPYGQTNCKWDTPIDLEKMWIHFKRIRKDTTPIIFTTTTRFGHKLLESNFKEFKLDMVWAKTKKSGFLHGRKRPLTRHEMVYFFWKKQPTYNYLKYHKYKKEAEECYKKIKEGKAPSGKIAKEGVVYANGLARCNVYERKKKSIYADTKTAGNSSSKPLYEPELPSSVLDFETTTLKEGDIYYGGEGMKMLKDHSVSYNPPLPSSVLEIKSKKATKHQTSKPLELMEFILKYWTNEGDKVLDITMGGGSMGKVAKNMNRDFIGVEKDKEIFNMANKYINE